MIFWVVRVKVIHGEYLLGQINPDIAIKSGNEADDKVYFCHRKYNGSDIYFIYNHSKKFFDDNIILNTDSHYAER